MEWNELEKVEMRLIRIYVSYKTQFRNANKESSPKGNNYIYHYKKKYGA